MKVLWLTNILLPQIAEDLSMPISYGGGWLVGLANDLLKQDNVNLTICTPVININNLINIKKNKLKNYCIPQIKKNPSKYNEQLDGYFEDIIKKENPDVIHIFGTEYSHSLSMINVCERFGIKDKVVINIQGLVSTIENHYYNNLPQKVRYSYTIRDFVRNDNIKKQRDKFKKRSRYEIESIKKVKHVIGRTDWDKACTYLMNNKVNYYFCNETLRDTFYKHEWKIDKCKKYSIFVSQSSYPIKGFHFMLEAMPKILEIYPDAHIYTTGLNPLNMKSFKEKLKMTSYQKYIGSLIKKHNLEENVTFLGNLDEEKMCNQFLKSHVFVSPSVVENESNSLSEAKMLGVPSVASFVGGVTNRINHGVDGFHYQYDATYMLAYYVCKVFKDNNLALALSKNSKISARKVNDRNKNLHDMVGIYKLIVNSD